jgi:hypothetical protein
MNEQPFPAPKPNEALYDDMMAEIESHAQSLTRVPIMATPDSAIAKLKKLMGAT